MKMVKTFKCNSCKTSLANGIGAVKFKCPSCKDEDIIRCSHCREIAARYKCNKCGFSGPN
jgi:Zn-ribbon RNA-binding protein